VTVKGQYCWDILLFQQNVLCYYLVVYNNFVLQQASAPVHLTFNTVQLLQCKTLNFISTALQLWPHNSPELNFTDCKIYGVIIAARTWVASIKTEYIKPATWLKPGNAAVQNWVKECHFIFFISPGNAEALLRSGGKIRYLLIAYFLISICAKLFQNRFLYVRILARQMTFLLGHSVFLVMDGYFQWSICSILIYLNINFKTVAL